MTSAGLLLGGVLTVVAGGTAHAGAAQLPSAQPAVDVDNPACVVVIQPGDSLSLIADGVDDAAVTAGSLRVENGIADADVIHAGEYLDICVENGINDISGEPRVGAADDSGVKAQQRKLNELFAGFGIAELAIDGWSGPLTRQMLCAARVSLNLPISRADMAPGDDEERALMAATSLPIPATAEVSAERWILIDKTCQVMFAGESSNGIKYVFPTSTGEPGWETRNLDGVRVFRYDPALDNAGWHNSTKFPVAADNPLNGNMYRPLYFYDGQAIHGANNVPPEPRSKGCARLRVEHQDALIAWLGLDDAAEPTWSRDRINLRVTVQGEFAPQPDESRD